MASGTINFSQSSSSGKYIDGKIIWSSTADKAANNSDVTAKLYVRKGDTTQTLTIPTSGTWSYTLTINGSTTSGTVSKSVLEDWVLVATKTVNNISHNTDGSKQITIYGSVTAPSSTSFDGHKTSGSGTATLDTIPRATTVDKLVCSTSYLNGDITTTYTPKSASYYNKIIYYLKQNSAYTTIRSTKLGKKSEAQTTYSIAFSSSELSTIYSKITTTTKATIRASIITYSDSGYSTQVGNTQYLEITLTIPTSVKPTTSLSVSPSNSNSWINSKNIYVAGYSKASFTLSASAGSGASLKSLEITGNNFSKSTSTTSASVSFSTTTAILTTSGSFTYKGTATDSRSRSTSSSKTITILPYSIPKITALTIQRGTYSSGWTAAESGPDVKVSFKTTLKLGDNGNVYKATFKLDGTSKTPNYGSTTNLASGAARIVYFKNIDSESSHSLTLTATDSVGNSVSATVTIPTINVTMEFNASGKGIAFGKTSEKDAFECAMDAEFNKSVKIGGSTLADYVVEQGKSGIWTYRKWNSGIAECWGSTYGSRTFNTTWGSLYVCSSTSAINYPFTFIERPIENATVRTTAPACWLYSESSNDGMNTTTTTGKYCAARPTQITTSCTLYIDFHVVGRWK